MNKPIDVNDGLINLVSGMGTRRDKSAASFYTKSNSLNNWDELEAFYNENWVAQKIVHAVALDMTREWREIKCQSLSPEQIDEFNNEETRLQTKHKMQEAIMWARLYGGAVMIPILKGQGDVSTPLNLETIKKGALTGYNVMEARSIYPTTHVDYNPFSPNFLLPEFYVAFGSQQRIHHTRLIRFIGKPLPRFERQRNRYWGLSAIQAIRKTLIDAETGVGACSSLLHEANIDIISIKELFNKLAAGGEQEIKTRFELYHTLKSIYNVTIVDSEEQVNNRQLSLSGMDRLLEQFYKIVAGACDIPFTRLMGQSAAGFNATGEADMRNYYDMLHNEQELQMRPALAVLDEIQCRSMWGRNVEDFGFKFRPLWQETSKEAADREKVEADRDKVYLDAMVLPPSIVAKQLKQRGTYDNISREYIAFLEAEELDYEAPTDPAEDETNVEEGEEEAPASSSSVESE